MKVLLDEGVPRQLVRWLPGHEVTTVPDAGWASVKNGVLLGLIEGAGYRAFVSCDQNLTFQQSGLERWPFAILILSTNHFQTMKPHLNEIADALDHCKPGKVEEVDCGKFIARKFRPGRPQP